jgi:hypothetical protein
VTLQEEFNQRLLTLRNVHFADAAGRLISLLAWLEQEPVTRALVQKLDSSVDVERLFKDANVHQRPRADTMQEIAAVGLQLIRECRDHNVALFQICMAVNIRGPFESGKFQDMTDAALREYMVPFLEYIEQGLQHAAAEYSSSNVADHRLSELLSTDFSKLLPRTAANMTRLSGEFLRSESEVAWQNVGNSCRQTLIDFAAELYEVCGVDRPPDIQAGNVKGLLKSISSPIWGDGRFRDTLLSAIEAVWNHTQAITHRNATSKEDALRVFLWTGLVISEFVAPLRNYLQR